MVERPILQGSMFGSVQHLGEQVEAVTVPEVTPKIHSEQFVISESVSQQKPKEVNYFIFGQINAFFFRLFQE
jgi:hypothetical protein